MCLPVLKLYIKDTGFVQNTFFDLFFSVFFLGRQSHCGHELVKGRIVVWNQCSRTRVPFSWGCSIFTESASSESVDEDCEAVKNCPWDQLTPFSWVSLSLPGSGSTQNRVYMFLTQSPHSSKGGYFLAPPCQASKITSLTSSIIKTLNPAVTEEVKLLIKN